MIDDIEGPASCRAGCKVRWRILNSYEVSGDGRLLDTPITANYRTATIQWVHRGTVGLRIDLGTRDYVLYHA